MDPDNLFFSRRTAWLVRFDYLVVLGLLVFVLISQWEQLNLLHFVLAIVWQDLIGYYPAAAVFYLGSRDPQQRKVPRFFYVVYNIFHGVPLNAAVLVTWWVLAGGWEPAMLAIPIHLCIDRGVFGRFYKAFCIAFEPVAHPEFKRFTEGIARERLWGLPRATGAAAPAAVRDVPAPVKPVMVQTGRSAL